MIANLSGDRPVLVDGNLGASEKLQKKASSPFGIFIMNLDRRTALCGSKRYLGPLNLEIHLKLVRVHDGLFRNKGAGTAYAGF